MKLVINTCYGGFRLSDKALAELGIEYYQQYDISRFDERLIKMVEEDAEGTSGRHAELTVVELPAETTDYHIEEYDGYESVIYVVNGKLHWAE